MYKELAFLMILAASLSVSAWACDGHDEAAVEGKSTEEFLSTSSAHPAGTETAVFKIKEIHCASCKRHIEAALKGVDGVEAVRVDIKARTAEIAFVPGKVTQAALIKIVGDAGYTASPMAAAKKL